MKIQHRLIPAAGLAALLLLGGAALTGCAAEPGTSGGAGSDAGSGSSSAESSFAGDWGVTEPGQPSVIIREDGTFNGTDGCNTLTGTGKISGDTFEFGAFALTRMACPGVDTWFSGASTATVSGGTLTVQAEDGTKIGTLEKQ